MYASHPTREQVDLRPVWRAGVTAAALAVIVNAIVRTITGSAFNISPEFRPFTWPQFTLFTVIGVLGATLLYAYLLRRAERPRETFRKIAIAVLLVSFLPDVGLLVTQAVPGMSMPAFVALIIMHITTAAISIRLLSGCPHPQ
jgi:hypothetical protein